MKNFKSCNSFKLFTILYIGYQLKGYISNSKKHKEVVWDMATIVANILTCDHIFSIAAYVVAKYASL